ncbi:hypothetical protein Bca101_058994 [Brassica carinata]
MEKQSDKKITWVIKNYSSLQSKIVKSDIFVVGRCRWRLVAYPKGNNKANNFSLFLAVADSELLPLGWRRHVDVSFTVVNQFSDKLSELKETQNWLDKTKPDWGFTDMINLTELYAKKGFLVNGEVKIVVKVDVLEVQGKADVKEESSPVMETIDVSGFQVLPSQEISKDDLSEEYAALSYLTDAGFQLDWLGKKLDEVKENKKKEKACLAQIQEMNEELQPLKRKCSEMEAQMDKVEAELSETSALLKLE